MEITLTRKTITNVLGIFLFIAVIFGGYFSWSKSSFNGWFSKTGTIQEAPANEPAIVGLTILYSPSGDRSDWEEQVCNGMTDQGCELFQAIFADPIWKSSSEEKTVAVVFIASVETLEDGSQVWKTEVSDGDVAQSVYIHVAQNESGQWLLNRVLFAQEAAKYEDQ